jgi:hypothetical protein
MSAPLQEKMTLATLPQEVLKIVLAHSHDLDSLLSTVASCRAFYAAFHTSPSSLTQALVFREIDAAVLPEAIQTLRAALFHRHRHRLPSSDPHLAVSSLFGEGRDALLNYRWNLADGIAVIRLHSIVETFTSEFASYYLSWLQRHSKCEQEGPPSIQERARIKRALYRFETYCNLFPPPQDLVSFIVFALGERAACLCPRVHVAPSHSRYVPIRPKADLLRLAPMMQTD